MCFFFSAGSILLQGICFFSLAQENLKGSLPWWPSCHRIWRWVIVPPDLFLAVASQAISFSMCCLFYLNHAQIYCTVKHTAMIICANCAEWLPQIRRYNNSRPLNDHENGCHPTKLAQGLKRDTILPYKFLDLALTFLIGKLFRMITIPFDTRCENVWVCCHLLNAGHVVQQTI